MPTFDLRSLITDIYPFSHGIEVFAYAANPRLTSAKTQIVMDA
jgi:hypothetical protein